MSEPLLWLSLGALAVQAALFLSKDLQPIHFWVLTMLNWNCLFGLPYAIDAAYLKSLLMKTSAMPWISLFLVAISIWRPRSR